jgi:uncharacterized protein (TIGR03435 family)
VPTRHRPCNCWGSRLGPVPHPLGAAAANWEVVVLLFCSPRAQFAAGSRIGPPRTLRRSFAAGPNSNCLLNGAAERIILLETNSERGLSGIVWHMRWRMQILGLRRFILMSGLVLVVSKGIHGQEFEVAVIRPTSADMNTGTSFNVFEGGRLRITNEPVKLLIRVAFQLQNSQIVGGPSWLDTDRYDIEAKTGRPERITPGQLSPLMQNLLAERFHLRFHRETREMAVGALMVAKGGPRLKAKVEGEGAAMNTSGGPGTSQLIATGVSMELLAGYVANRLGRVVVDRTGLSDSYDFTLDWSPDPPPDSKAPTLITALQEQLGLRLERQKAPVEVLVIDGIERPSQN